MYCLHQDNWPLATPSLHIIAIPGTVRLAAADLRRLLDGAIPEPPRDAHVNQFLAVYLHALGERPAPQYRPREPDSLKAFDELHWTRGIPIEERRRREALLWAEHDRKEDEASWTPAMYDVLCGSVGTVTYEGVDARMTARILRSEDGKATLDEYMTQAVAVFAATRPGDIYVADYRWRHALNAAAWFASFDRKTLTRAGVEERAWAAAYEQRQQASARAGTGRLDRIWRGLKRCFERT